MSKKKLSILIPSLISRKRYLDELSEVLKPQVLQNQNDVEVLINLDNGESSIGRKRNDLISSATGDYIAFVDDDDLVSNDYIPLLLNAIDKSPDVVGIHLLMTVDNVLKGLTYHSLNYKTWFNKQSIIPNINCYFRNPNHLNPIKKDIIKNVKFLEINMGEDRDYSQKILPLINSEVYIPEPIYLYRVRSVKEC